MRYGQAAKQPQWNKAQPGSASEISFVLQRDFLWDDPDEHGNSCLHEIGLLTFKIPAETATRMLEFTELCTELELSSSNWENYFPFMMMLLTAVDIARHTRTTWFGSCSIQKFRAAKMLELGYPSKNLWMNSHCQWFPHLWHRALPLWAGSGCSRRMYSACQPCTTGIAAEPKCRSKLLFNLHKVLHYFHQQTTSHIWSCQCASVAWHLERRNAENQKEKHTFSLQ